jgi:hypothetical protein
VLHIGTKVNSATVTSILFVICDHNDVQQHIKLLKNKTYLLTSSFDCLPHSSIVKEKRELAAKKNERITKHHATKISTFAIFSTII